MSADQNIHNFSQLVSLIGDGEVNNSLSETLREMVAQLNQAAMERGGKHTGKITLSMSLTIDKGVIVVEADQPKVVIPKEPKVSSLFWSTADNKLSLSNPRQMALPLRDVTEATSATA